MAELNADLHADLHVEGHVKSSVEHNHPQVEVMYCEQSKIHRVRVDWHAHLTASQALQLSGLADQLDLPKPLKLGIYGLKISNPERYLMQAGDRLEIYRPLIIDPKQIRRNRAARFPVGRYQQGNQARKKMK